MLLLLLPVYMIAAPVIHQAVQQVVDKAVHSSSNVELVRPTAVCAGRG